MLTPSLGAVEPVGSVLTFIPRDILLFANRAAGKCQTDGGEQKCCSARDCPEKPQLFPFSFSLFLSYFQLPHLRLVVDGREKSVRINDECNNPEEPGAMLSRCRELPQTRPEECGLGEQRKRDGALRSPYWMSRVEKGFHSGIQGLRRLEHSQHHTFLSW